MKPVDMSGAALQLVEDSGQSVLNLDPEDREVRRLIAAAARGEEEQRALGAKLIVIRRRWPTSGPDAGGWSVYCREHGLSTKTALRYMARARETAPRAPKKKLTLGEREEAKIQWVLERATLDFMKRLRVRLDTRIAAHDKTGAVTNAQSAAWARRSA